jgi:hypothetical protein
MINLLWSGLNLVLLLGTCYILFRAAKLVRQHMGWGAALLFIFALLALSGRRAATPGGPAKNLLTKAPAHGPLANASAGQTIDLGGSNKLFLRAEYDANGNTLTPHGLYAGVSGLMLGHEWEPSMGTLQPEGSQLHYWTVLNHRWLLLGVPVLSSNGVEFEGVMKPDQPLAQR